MTIYPLIKTTVSLVLLFGASVHVAVAQSGGAPQASRSNTIEEVIVTARKRSESLQETPLAVSAFSAQALEDAGIGTLDDLQNHVPGLDISSAFKGGLVTIRSVAPTGGGGAWAEQPTSLYIDDVFQAHSTTRLLDLVDVESIQVLRGPQGTLFGKNSTAGALVITTQKPAPEFLVNVKASVGDYGRNEFRVAANVPLVDEKLYSKVVFNRVRQDGFYENLTDGKDLYGSHRDSFAAQLRWQMESGDTLDLILSRTREIEIPRASSCRKVDYAAGETVPIIGLLIDPENTDKNYSQLCEEVQDLPHDKVINNPYRHNEKGYAAGSFDFRSTYLSGVFNKSFENFDFKSVTAWGFNEQYDRNAFESDLDGTQLNVAYIFNRDTMEQTQISQEFQFTGDIWDGRAQWQAGAFALITKSGKGTVETLSGVGGILGVKVADTQGIDSPGGGGIGPISAADLATASAASGVSGEQVVVVNVIFGHSPTVNSETYAAYNQWTFDLSERWELTAGARYSVEFKEAGSLDRVRGLAPQDIPDTTPAGVYDPNTNLYITDLETFKTLPERWGNPIPSAPEGFEFFDRVRFSQVTPMVSSSWMFEEGELAEFVDNAMIYATVAAGFKGGGLRPNATGVVPFDPEEMVNYEFGMKTDLFDRTLRVNWNIFFMDYTNKQVLIARPVPDEVDIDQVLTNIDAVTLTGTEWEVFWAPVAGLDINFGFSYVDDEISEFNDTALQGGSLVTIDRSDERSYNTRTTSANMGIQYEWATDRFGTFSARLDASYKSDLYWGLDSPTWKNRQARDFATTPAQTLFGARFNWFISDRYKLTVWAKNLTNEEYQANGIGNAGSFANITTITAPPRTLGMDFSADFL